MAILVYDSDDALEVQNREKANHEAETKYLKEVEIIKLLSSIENEFHSLLFLFLFETGARCSEALNVKIKDIDPYNKTVKLITLKRRRQVYRVLGISDALLTKVLLYDKKLGLKADDYLFAKKSGGIPITIQAVNKAMKKYVNQILGTEYKDYGHPHVLRHSRAIQLLNSGEVDLAKLMRFLGHSHIRNTLIYAQFSNKDIQDSVRRANEKIGLH